MAYIVLLKNALGIMMKLNYFLILGLYLMLSGCDKTPPDALPYPIEYPEQQRDVTFKSDTFTLHGTLTIPATTNKRPPVVVFVQGSGNMDRDGYSPQLPQGFPKFYKNWAAYFKSKGIAIFRYDKRFVTHPNINVASFSQTDQVNDALAAVNFLKNDTSVNANLIFMLGHSEGGNLVPVAAKNDKAVKGMVVVNAAAFSVDSLLYEQLRLNAGVDEATIKQVQDGFKAIRNNTFPSNRVFLGAGKDYWKQWIDYSQNADKYMIEADVPGLIIFSGSDENFPGETLEKNRQSWQQIDSNSDKLEMKTYKDVTHNLFIKNTNNQQQADKVLLDISGWLLAR
ncbi:MAG: alpha/beta hydrolase [Bacteroidia bacterium]